METAAIMRMKELVQKLDRAAKAYYQQDTEINKQQRVRSDVRRASGLEKETRHLFWQTGPTVSVGYRGQV